jgi:hypothetical protein
MPTTTNYGWTTPADTDLVKDGAAAIRTLGSSIDTSMAELKGGTTGQFLSKTSNTDMDFTWASTAAYTLISSKTFSNDASTHTFSSIPQTYTHLLVTGDGLQFNLATPTRYFVLQYNGVTSATYSSSNMLANGASLTTSQSQAATTGWIGSFASRSGDTDGYRKGRFMINFPNYTDTTHQKQVQYVGGSYAGGQAEYGTGTITNSATTAISSITIFNPNGENVLTGIFRLWGIK